GLLQSHFSLRVYSLYEAHMYLLICVQLELEYCCVRSVNRKNGKNMQRVWVHGKFKKPTSQ
uniref:Uncharacterized protein n=1 Tax=Aegilops tauschii subsp. strangulata TaxID=200361 RepID=A0A453RAH6_AEGTS